MEEYPLVSIVTPSYNQAEFLEETIQSVLAQDYPALEYIIVDGGSTDGSLEIIQRYQDHLAAWISEPDRGQTDAINKGFALSKGSVMAWLNSDDLYHPGAVSSAVNYLKENPEIALVYGDTELIDAQGQSLGRFNARQTSYPRLMRGGVYIPQPAAFWRREIWEQVGPLDTSFYFAMDYDLWVKIAKEAEIRYHPLLWASFRLHSTGKTTQADDRCWPEMLKVYRREGGSLISIFMGKYVLRRLLGPVWIWYKDQKLKVRASGEFNG